MQRRFNRWLTGLLGIFLMLLLCPAMGQAAEKPVVVVAGFQSRVTNTNVNVKQDEMLPIAATTVYSELTNNPAYTVKDITEFTTQARMDEASLIKDLGDGKITPELQADADYVVFGYLTNISGVKAQSGALGMRGKDTTVNLELTMRVLDTHTGAVVFVATSDAKRKSELKYHAIWSRNDKGSEDAVEEALLVAATNLAAQFQKAAA